VCFLPRRGGLDTSPFLSPAHGEFGQFVNPFIVRDPDAGRYPPLIFSKDHAEGECEPDELAGVHVRDPVGTHGSGFVCVVVEAVCCGTYPAIDFAAVGVDAHVTVLLPCSFQRCVVRGFSEVCRRYCHRGRLFPGAKKSALMVLLWGHRGTAPCGLPPASGERGEGSTGLAIIGM